MAATIIGDCVGMTFGSGSIFHNLVCPIPFVSVCHDLSWAWQFHVTAFSILPTIVLPPLCITSVNHSSSPVRALLSSFTCPKHCKN